MFHVLKIVSLFVLGFLGYAAANGDVSCGGVTCPPYSSCLLSPQGTFQCVCNDGCTTNYQPVCGSDNVTYTNLCTMMTASCRSGNLVTVQRSGQCDPFAITCANILCGFYSTCRLKEDNTYGCVCDTMCIAIYEPVCGTDGVTYSSLCNLRASSCGKGKLIAAAYEGVCNGTVDPCTSKPCDFYEVCHGQGNGTYTCKCHNEPCPQTFRYDPICGSNGVTYPGICEMEKAACRSKTMVTLAYRGQCGSHDPCLSSPCNFHGICRGYQNGTYSCHCSVEMCPLTFRYDPICGSNGVTYPGECEMRKEACRTRTNIVLAYRGECNTTDTCGGRICHHYSRCRQSTDGRDECVCEEGCTDEYNPVCGSNDVTYSNLCELKSESCRTTTKILVKSIGRCQAIDPCATMRCGYYSTCQRNSDGDYGCACNDVCTEEYTPLCGSDHVTYSNLCFMKAASCRLQRMIAVAYRGECHVNTTNPCAAAICPYGKVCLTTVEGKAECICQDVCTREYRPVCGTDGVTYPNECEIRCKLETGVSVLHQGPCGAHQPAVHGTIYLPDFHAPPFAYKSCLRVVLFDDRIADAPATKIGESVYYINSHHKAGDPLPYTVAFDNNVGNAVDFAVSAVLNINWCSHGNDEWVRSGDYLTTESYRITVENNVPEKLNLKLGYYGSSSCESGEIPCASGTTCVDVKAGQTACITCEIACTAEYLPVCGTDGKTYPNACTATSLNGCVTRRVFVEHHGECKDGDSMKAVWIVIIVLAALSLVTMVVIVGVYFTMKKKKTVYVSKDAEFVKPPVITREIEIVKEPVV